MPLIEDGLGNEYFAEVDKNNKLATTSVTRAQMQDISERDARAFTFAHGDFISISNTDTETGIIHIKNTSTTQDLVIYSIRTCGTVLQKWKLYKNSTGGTLISNETAGLAVNLNLKSKRRAEATVYKGAEGITLSGGTMMEHWINAIGPSNEILDGALILGKNDSIELTVELPSAGDVCTRTIGYFK